MSVPLVSVVIPAKDQEAFIFDSLQSLTHQQVAPRDIEVVVVDDGSSDQTSAIAHEFGDRFGWFTVVRNESALGVSAARNQGIEIASGSSFCFLDPDDWYGPGFLRRCLDALERFDADFVRTDHTRQTGNRRELWRAPELRRNRVLDPLDDVSAVERTTMLDYPYPCTGLFDARLVRSGVLTFDEECRTAEDRELMWRVHTSSTKYAVISEPGFFYRRGVPGSLTAQFSAHQLGYVTAFTQVFAGLRARQSALDPQLVTALQAKAARQFLAITVFHIERVRKAQAAQLTPPTSTSPTPALAPQELQAAQTPHTEYLAQLSGNVRKFLAALPLVDQARTQLSEYRQGLFAELLSLPHEPTAVVSARAQVGG